MKFRIFSYFCGTFLPSWIRIRIPNTDPDTLTWLNPDPKRCIKQAKCDEYGTSLNFFSLHRFIETDRSPAEKMARLAVLLALSQPPTRSRITDMFLPALRIPLIRNWLSSSILTIFSKDYNYNYKILWFTRIHILFNVHKNVQVGPGTADPKEIFTDSVHFVRIWSNISSSRKTYFFK